MNLEPTSVVDITVVPDIRMLPLPLLGELGGAVVAVILVIMNQRMQLPVSTPETVEAAMVVKALGAVLTRPLLGPYTLMALVTVHLPAGTVFKVVGLTEHELGVGDIDAPVGKRFDTGSDKVVVARCLAGQ